MMENSNNPFPFASVQVIPTYRPLERAIQWALEPTFQGVAPFTFVVEAAETPTFSELLYSLPPTDGYFVIDQERKHQSNTLMVYYRVRLTTGEGKQYISPVLTCHAFGQSRNQYLKAREIVRREFVRYRYSGQKGWLLKRKNYGVKDPDMLDPITGVPLCDENGDLGTGFVGGYHKAIPVTYSRERVATATALNEQGLGISFVENQSHRYVGFPAVHAYDVLVTDENKRYRYTGVQPVFMPGTDILILQVAECSLLPPTDSVYSIDITK